MARLFRGSEKDKSKVLMVLITNMIMLCYIKEVEEGEESVFVFLLFGCESLETLKGKVEVRLIKS